MSLSAEYERLMARIRPQLPGAVDAMIQHELYAVLDEFCKETNIWRDEIRVPVTTAKISYEIDANEPASKIVRLLKTYTGDDIGISAIMPIPGQLDIPYAPSQAMNYYALVALTIADPVDTDGYPRPPEWLVTRYREAIYDGLLATMMSQPAKPYSNERMAVYHGRRFRNAIGVARSEGLHQNLYAGQAWRFPSNFAR